MSARAERQNHQELTPAEVRRRADAWFTRQIEILKLAHGDRWPEHQEWLEDYLRAELRERLLELGWRPKRGRD